jgi:hypothetical protein
MTEKSNREWPSTIAMMAGLGMIEPGDHPLKWARDFDKPAGQRCPHQRHHKGCSIYKARPMGCRVWSCQWLVNGDTAAMSRPDRSHYVIDMSPDFVRGIDDDGNETICPVVQIWLDPDYPDAYRDPSLRRFLEKQFAKGSAALIRITRDKSIFIIGPPMTPEWREVNTMQDEHEHTAEEKARALGPVSITFEE